MNGITCDLEMFILKRACLVCVSGLFEPFPSEGRGTRKNGKVRCSLLVLRTITTTVGSDTAPHTAARALGRVSVLSGGISAKVSTLCLSETTHRGSSRGEQI